MAKRTTKQAPAFDSKGWPIMPEFLRKPKGVPVDLRLIDPHGAKREWIMPSKERLKEKERNPVLVDRPDNPVEVVYKDKAGKNLLLARYENLAAYEAKHDVATYPVARVLSGAELTLIQVSPKPWAARKDEPPPVRAARPPKKERSYAGTGTGKPVKRASSVGKILELMIAGRHTFEQIVALSGVEDGEVIPAASKVDHRMKHVLHTQHGVGFEADARGVIRAHLPKGFDEKTIFKG